MTTLDICEALARHLEHTGEEMFEKNFIKADGKIHCSVFAVIGPNAEEFTALVREWATKSGFKRHDYEGHAEV